MYKYSDSNWINYVLLEVIPFVQSFSSGHYYAESLGGKVKELW